MKIEQFTEQFRLRITRDECGNKIISGKRGHLYFAGGDLCLMVIDGAPAHPSRWQALGGKLWMGEISLDKSGRRVQDVWIKGIPLENALAAIRMVRAHRKRLLSAEEREALLARLPKGETGPEKRPFSR